MLHQIGQLAKTEYHHFHLLVVLISHHSNRLKKNKLERPYHHSKAGHKHFHIIHSITSQCKAYEQTSSKLNTNNLIKITNQNDTSLHQNIAISHINARSVIPKILSFQEYIMSRDSHLCVITEMWLKADDEMAHKSIPPDGYKIISHPRTNG